MGRFFVYLLLMMLTLIIQLVIPPSFAIFGVKPDLLLILVVIIALIRGRKYGSGFGFIAGSLQDLFLGGFFGVFTFIKTFIGIVVGLIEGNFFKEQYIISTLVIFVATIVNETLLILLSENLLFTVNYWIVLCNLILPEAILNGLIGLIIYPIIYRIDNSGGSYYG